MKLLESPASAGLAKRIVPDSNKARPGLAPITS
jgi:hypothetical protein